MKTEYLNITSYNGCTTIRPTKYSEKLLRRQMTNREVIFYKILPDQKNPRYKDKIYWLANSCQLKVKVVDVRYNILLPPDGYIPESFDFVPSDYLGIDYK